VIICKTAKAKQTLAKGLAKHNPEILEFFKITAEAFGASESAGYEGVGEEQIKKVLLEYRKNLAADEIQKMKGNLR